MKRIVALMIADPVEPYKTMGFRIPRVVVSDHPRFKVGTRFDWGFVQLALDDGYTVEIRP